MQLFWKKKKEEKDEEISFSDGLVEKSKRGRKKKEPPRPWGGKERILVFLVIFLTIGVSSVLSLNARSWKLPGMPRIKVPEFDLPFCLRKQ